MEETFSSLGVVVARVVLVTRTQKGFHVARILELCVQFATCAALFITNRSITARAPSTEYACFKYTRNKLTLTLSPPIPLTLYTLPYWSNPPFLIFGILALWHSVLSARVPECQKLEMVG